MHEDILSVESRRKVYECVSENPGAHLREIGRRAGLPLGTTLYHLDCLQSHAMLIARRDGRYKRYFTAHGLGRQDKDLLSILRHDAPRRIVQALLARGPSTQRELCKALGLSRSTLSFHVNRLVQEGVALREARRPENVYSLREPASAAGLLHRFARSLDPASLMQTAPDQMAVV